MQFLKEIGMVVNGSKTLYSSRDKESKTIYIRIIQSLSVCSSIKNPNRLTDLADNLHMGANLLGGEKCEQFNTLASLIVVPYLLPPGSNL